MTLHYLYNQLTTPVEDCDTPCKRTPASASEYKYIRLVRKLLMWPAWTQTRNAMTTSIFGKRLVHDFSQGFPLFTHKFISMRNIFYELTFFLSAGVNRNWLSDKNVKIWDQFGDEHGNLGPIYGYQWRNWNNTGLDQYKTLIEGLISDPTSRRHIITGWNPSQLKDMALPPCHILYQYYVKNVNDTKYLSLQVYQRSADIILGLPYDVASYALLLELLCSHLSFKTDQIWRPGKLIICFGDLHLYQSHVSAAETVTGRILEVLPKLKLLHPITEFGCEYFRNLKYIETVELVNYKPSTPITAELVS